VKDQEIEIIAELAQKFSVRLDRSEISKRQKRFNGDLAFYLEGEQDDRLVLYNPTIRKVRLYKTGESWVGGNHIAAIAIALTGRSDLECRSNLLETIRETEKRLIESSIIDALQLERQFVD